MRRFFFTVLLLGTTIISASAQNGLDADMKLFSSWFEGRFDNFAQAYDDKETKAEHPHEHIHSIFKRVDLPAIGKDVFFVQQYMDGDETKVYRQRLYSFSTDKAEKALKLTIYNFDDEKKYRDSHLDPTKLSALTMANLTTVSGCEVYWKLNTTKDKFDGYMRKDACRVDSKRLGKTIIITDDLFLTKDEIWINDQARDLQGGYVFGNKSNIHAKLKRVRIFEGWTAVAKDGSTAMATADLPAEAYDGKRGLITYDQGGFLKLNDKYTARLAQMTYKSGLKVMTLSIIDNASGKNVAYAWTNPDAERIGINLRWVQIGLTLKK